MTEANVTEELQRSNALSPATVKNSSMHYSKWCLVVTNSSLPQANSHNHIHITVSVNKEVT